MGDAKGTIPIIGVTKVDQVQDVVQVAEVNLTEDEMNWLQSRPKLIQEALGKIRWLDIRTYCYHI